MKRGDTVVCVNSDGVEKRLTEQKTYQVLQISGEFIGVLDDNNEVHSFRSLRFKLKEKKNV